MNNINTDVSYGSLKLDHIAYLLYCIDSFFFFSLVNVSICAYSDHWPMMHLSHSDCRTYSVCLPALKRYCVKYECLAIKLHLKHLVADCIIYNKHLLFIKNH